MSSSKPQDVHFPPHGIAEAGAEHPRAPAIREELQRILQSHAFRTSRRSQQFLTFVVEHTISSKTEDLKERTIGVTVFDRPPSYDTGEDATVRVAANEVRKRLAQYQLESPGREVRIELPLGTYVPEFRLPEEPAGDPPQLQAAAPARSPEAIPKPIAGPGSWLRIGLAAAAVLAASFLLLRHTARTPFDDFWRPVIESPRPALICMAHPAMFHVMGRLQNEYKAKGYNDKPATKGEGRAVTVELQPGDIVQTEQYVGSGDAFAAGVLSALLSRLEKPMQLRIGHDMSFSDLRSSPAILIGAYSNRWTMQSNAEYRFGFGPHSVVDHASGKEWRISNMTPDYRAPEDYAIVSRVLQSYSGLPVITAAGTTNMGTRAAAEFLTNPEHLNQALAQAPAGWQRKNLQIVLYCKGIGTTPGPAKVIATHIW